MGVKQNRRLDTCPDNLGCRDFFVVASGILCELRLNFAVATAEMEKEAGIVVLMFQNIKKIRRKQEK